MRPPRVAEVDVGRQLFLGFTDVLVGMERDGLVFRTAPQPLDEHIIDPAALAVHDDAAAVRLEHASELNRMGNRAAAFGAYVSRDEKAFYAATNKPTSDSLYNVANDHDQK